MSDPVNHPSHYTNGKIECIDAIEASMSKEEFQGFLKGNIMKYTWRYRQKGGAQDLGKAEFYLKRLLESWNSEAKPATGLKYDPSTLIPTTINPVAPTPIPQSLVGARITQCRNFLQKTGLPYPKSGCAVCGSIITSKCKFDV